MNQRILTGTLFTLGIIVFMLPGYWWPAIPLILLALVGYLGSWEIDRALHQKGLSLPPLLSRLGILIFLMPLLAKWPTLIPDPSLSPLQNWQLPALAGYLLLVTGLLLWSTLTGVSLLIRRGPGAMPQIVVTVTHYFYLVLPMGSAVLLLYFIPRGWYWLVLAMLSTWVSDVMAFFVGISLGKHKIVPQISPKKSVEGTFGGLAGGVIATAAMLPFITGQPVSAYFEQPVLIAAAVVIGAFLSLASQFGDWMASGIKRWCDVKDFGHWLPGHGGILDRFDGILFTLPVTFLLAAILTSF